MEAPASTLMNSVSVLQDDHRAMGPEGQHSKRSDEPDSTVIDDPPACRRDLDNLPVEICQVNEQPAVMGSRPGSLPCAPGV